MEAPLQPNHAFVIWIRQTNFYNYIIVIEVILLRSYLSWLNIKQQFSYNNPILTEYLGRTKKNTGIFSILFIIIFLSTNAHTTLTYKVVLYINC